MLDNAPLTGLIVSGFVGVCGRFRIVQPDQRDRRLRHASVWLFAISDSFQLREALHRIRDSNPALRIIARTHSEDDRQMLEHTGIDLIVMGDRKIALRMGEHALRVLHIHTKPGG